jgi:TPR repeat protein
MNYSHFRRGCGRGAALLAANFGIMLALQFCLICWNCNGQADVTNSDRSRLFLQSWEAISNRWVLSAVPDLKRAAEQGEPSAQYYLGRLYQEGKTLGKDQAEAERWIASAAAQGLAEAQNRMGSMYENGVGVAKDERRGLEYYQKAARTGLAKAQFNLALIYEAGRVVSKDQAEALKLYRLAAEQGQARAQNSIGNCYLTGAGVPKDFKEAVRWFRQSAEQGEALGEANLGYMYDHGLGVPKDRHQAELWVGKAAEQKLAAAQYLMGLMATKQTELLGDSIMGNYPVAAEWFEKASAQNHIKAMVRLGDLYYYGKLGHDHRQAAKWFLRAAEKGDDEAIMHLGDLYSANHVDLPKDVTESVRWYRAAAEKGNPEGQYRLACLLIDGDGIAPQIPEAERWLRKAIESGYLEAAIKLAALQKTSQEPDFTGLSREDLQVAAYRTGEARLSLGKWYEEGRGGPVDLFRATETYWQILNLGPNKDAAEALDRLAALYAQKRVTFQKAAIYGPKDSDELGRRFRGYRRRFIKAESIFQVGEMFYRGENLPEDREQAVEWLLEAAQSGSKEAINRIGELWADGLSGEPDSKEATRWYRKAAAMGLGTAQLNLGRAYDKGAGVEQNPIEASAWLQLAVNQSASKAIEELGRVQAKLSPEQIKAAKRRADELALSRKDQ